MPFGKSKEPKAPKEKKSKPPKKEKPPKKAKPPKKPKKGAPSQEGEALEQGKKKKPILLLLLPIVVIVAAAAIIFLFVIKPRFFGDGDPEPTATVEPQPPVLPTELPVGDEKVPGMTLEADESEAQAVLAKTITYTYTDLVDAGKAAQTYVGQLKKASPSYSVVDEEFVRTDMPDFTASEGMVLLARTLPQPEPEPGETDEPGENSDADPEESGAEPTPTPEPKPEPEPTPEPVSYVITVRITWSPGQCVVTADEEEGKVTSPPMDSSMGGPGPSLSVSQAEEKLEGMTPAQLGLNGTTMDIYDVFPIDGVEMVDDVACMRLNVYSRDNPEHTNEFMGSYLMSIDGQHIYRVDPVTGAITVLE